MFELHPVLAGDSAVLGDFPLCRVLLIKDANYPWLVLVPRRDGMRELFELSWEDQQQYLRESAIVCELLQTLFGARKLNVAALGNMVPQLHIHHIARFESDPAWPGPVWGAVPNLPYQAEQLESRCREIVQQLSSSAEPFTAL